MASHSSKRVIFAALAGNTLIAAIKFVAGAATGSSAMISEAIHSVVDTGNQGLLLLGIRRAQRPPDEDHPFGYGMEIYFWSFVVAIMVFAVGAGLSLYEGIDKLRHPRPVTDAYINYLVLGAAMLFEGGAWLIAFREFNRNRGETGFWTAVMRSKDPALFTVLFEDTAAMLGLVVALAGIALGERFASSDFDAAASLLIGCILAATAILLARETKGLLLGERASRDVIDGIRRIVAGYPAVVQVNELLTMHFGPEDVLLNLSLDFDDTLTAGQVEESISAMEAEIRQAYSQVRRVFIEAQSRAGHERNLAP